MAYVVFDRVKETTTSSGTGALTLSGALTGYTRFGAVMGVGDSCDYVIEDVQAGVWEVGFGTYSAANTLTRTTVYASSAGGAAVALAGNPSAVFICVPAARVNGFATANNSNLTGTTAMQAAAVAGAVTAGSVSAGSAAAGTVAINGNMGPAGTVPGNATGLLGTNFTNGSAEVDFFNCASGPVASFIWWQRTSGTSATNLMSLSSSGVLTLLAPLPVASGGTGANTAAGAVAALGAQPALGFTPVQQGTGAGQGSNAIKLGWSGAKLKLTVDTSDLGNVALESWAYAASNPSGYQTAANVSSTVSAAVANLVNGAPAALDTLGEIASQLASDESAAGALTNTVAGKVAKAGDTMSGPLTLTASGAQVRHSNGTYSLLNYVDSAAFYLLLTNSGDPNGAANALRPFSVNFATGQVTLGNGVSVAGGISADSLAITAGSASQPSVRLTGSAADAKLYDTLYSPNTIQFRFINDANTAASSWLSASRSGYTTTNVTLTATAINLSGAVSVVGGLTTDIHTVSSAGQARRIFTSAGAGADAKTADILTDGSNFLIRLLNDAQSAANTFFQVVRNGYTAASLALSAATINLNGATTITGGVTLGADGTYPINLGRSGQYFGWNTVFNTGFKYVAADPAFFFRNDGSSGVSFHAAPSGAAGAAITDVVAFTVSTGGVFALPVNPLGISSGGTGATTAAAAKTALGLATVASSGSYGDLQNPPAIPAASSALPLADGTATAGTSAAYSREGHVHPTDASRVAKTGDTMSGALTVQGAGTVYSLGVVNTPSATQWQNQGAYIGWNFTQGGGETSFINSKGFSAGGFAWYNTASSAGSVPTLLMTLNASGMLALTSPLAIGSGGTGGTTAAAALTSLGALGTAAAASTYALINNPAFTGNTFVYGASNTGAACGEEFGSTTTAQQAFKDWHSSGYANDYDVRESVTGGVNGTIGKGNYSITCASYTMYGCGPVINVGTDFIAKRIVSGNFGIAEYCDGSSYYHLITNSGQQLSTTFSGLRPFYYSLTTGVVGFDNGLTTADINVANTGYLAGAWNSFQATVAASTGTITTAAATVRWKKLGRTVWFNLYATVSNNGSGAGQLTVSLPFANNGSSPLMLISRDLNSLALLSGYIGTSGAAIAINRVSDNGYPIAANGSAGFAFSGVYEAAS